MSFLQVLGYIVVAFSALSLVSYWVVTSRESKRWSVVLDAWKKTSFTPDEVRADLDAYLDLYRRVHPNPYHALPREEVEAMFAEMKQGIDRDLTRPEVFCLLADAVCRFNDEHTQVNMPTAELNQLLGEEGKAFPYEVVFLSGRCFVTGARGDAGPLPSGTEILSINGVQLQEIIHRISRLFWGTRDQQREFYAQNRFQEALYLAYGFQDWFDLQIRLPDGTTRERRISGVEYKVQPKLPFSYRIMGDVLLFDYHEFEDPKGDFNAFLQEMFSVIRQKGIRALAIDLRANQGGTSGLGDRLLRHLTDEPFSQFDRVEIRSSPEIRRFFLSFLPAFMHWMFPLPYLHPMLRSLWRTKVGEITELRFQPIVPSDSDAPFEGEVYVLVGPGTMSSASLVAATVKHYRMGTLVGQETGGSPTHYGNMLDFHLPNTGIKVMIPSSINHGNGAEPVKPDVLIEPGLEDLLKGQDAVLEFIQREARKSEA